MGIFDGSMFDFNGDGRVDAGEEVIGYQILQSMFDDDEDDDDDEYDNDMFGYEGH